MLIEVASRFEKWLQSVKMFTITLNTHYNILYFNPKLFKIVNFEVKTVDHYFSTPLTMHKLTHPPIAKF